jgi:ubiquinone biosynthesis protein
MSIASTIKEVSRLRQIATVLAQQELFILVDKLKLKKHLPLNQKQKYVQDKSEIPRRLRLAMEGLSGAFVKLGQLLSLRADLIPKEYAEEFSRLQDEVNPVKFEKIKELIEKEFEKPLSEIFLKFDREPIAAASVGQVHKAMLNNGKIVAVKIQRPNIDKIFEMDIQLLYHLATLLERHYPELKDYNFMEIVKEFEEYTRNELDYMIEARNIDIFYNNFKNDPINIPKVYWNYTTKKVLTMEFIKGVKITEVTKNKPHYVKQIIESYIKQTMEYGTFHADPHPGNIFVMPNHQLALLDFGIVGHISKELRDNFEDVFVSLIKGDRDLLAESLVDLQIVDGDFSIEQFKEDISFHLGKYYDASLDKIDISSALYDILAVARKYRMKFPTNFVLLIKATATVEGFGKKLDPKFNFVKICRPYVEKLEEKRKSSTYLFETFKKNMWKFRKDFINFPDEIKKILKRGKVKVDIEDRDIRQFTFYLDSAINRLAAGIITAGLLIASALIIQADLKPLLFNIPLFSIVFILIALVIGYNLIKSVAEEKRRSQ